MITNKERVKRIKFLVEEANYHPFISRVNYKSRRDERGEFFQIEISLVSDTVTLNNYALARKGIISRDEAKQAAQRANTMRFNSIMELIKQFFPEAYYSGKTKFTVSEFKDKMPIYKTMNRKVEFTEC